MSTMIKKWVATSAFDRGANIQAYRYNDGSIHYLFRRAKSGRPSNVSEEELPKMIKDWRMELVFEVKE